jgi:hypothetical protein
MATAAPHVKLLRQLASAKDDYLSGAFDISWDGAKATLYLVFGRPSHAVFDTDQAQIEGEAAIDALLAELPRTFVVSDWRRAMSPQETLSISIDELAGPFVRLAGSYADDPVSDESPEWWSADDSSPDLAFGLADFPLLPGGRPLWAETSPENVNLAERLAELPPSILILTGAKLRAAAVVSGGDIIDAVWIDDEDQARGEAAGMAILGATKGTLAGYALDDPRVAEALTMLWRLPLAVKGIEMAWLDPASMLAAFRADGLDRVLVIDAPVRGIALFSRGGLVAVYSETQRAAVASPERLRSLLSQAKGRLTVMERKPRPVAAGASPTNPSAVDFFSVVNPEPEVEATTAAEPDFIADRTTPVLDEPASDVAPLSEPATTWSHPFLREHPLVPAVQDPHPDEAAEPAAPESAVADGAPDTEPSADAAAAVADVGEPVADQATDAPPPPPAADTPVPAAADDAPPPAPEAAAAEPGRLGKRRWWAFGTRRKSATQAPSDDDKAAAEAVAAQGAVEAASFAGWSVRQPDANAPPPWSRSRDHTLTEPDDAAATIETPPPATDAVSDETTTPEAPPTWSVIETGASVAHEPPPAGTESDDAPAAAPEEEPAAVDATVAAEPVAAEEASADEPAVAAEPVAAEGASVDEPAASDTGAEEPVSAVAPAWSAREVIADSVSWYRPPEQPEAVSGAPAEVEHDAVAHAEEGPAAGTADESVAAGEDEQTPLAAAEHESTGADTARDFWAEFVTPDPDAPAEDAEQQPEPLTASHGSAETVAPAPASEPEHEPVAAEDAEPAKRKSSERTFAPWSWPLAEAETPAAPAGRFESMFDEPPGHVTELVTADGVTDASTETAPHDTGFDTDAQADQGFFQRDEPVGSQFVDFDEVRKELVQIGMVWLGERNAVPVTALLTKTRSTIDDFVATIDTIRGLHVEGQDPASIQAMAREMHQQAAERLCGA